MHPDSGDLIPDLRLDIAVVDLATSSAISGKPAIGGFFFAGLAHRDGVWLK